MEIKFYGFCTCCNNREHILVDVKIGNDDEIVLQIGDDNPICVKKNDLYTLAEMIKLY